MELATPTPPPMPAELMPVFLLAETVLSTTFMEKSVIPLPPQLSAEPPARPPSLEMVLSMLTTAKNVMMETCGTGTVAPQQC